MLRPDGACADVGQATVIGLADYDVGRTYLLVARQLEQPVQQSIRNPMHVERRRQRNRTLEFAELL